MFLDRIGSWAAEDKVNVELGYFFGIFLLLATLESFLIGTSVTNASPLKQTTRRGGRLSES